MSRCLAALTPQHWELLIVGAAHGSRTAAEGVARVLDCFKPALVLVELDRRDFASVWAASAPGASADEVPATASFAAQAVPECASAIRWARKHPLTHRSSLQHSEAGCAVFPIDRDQLTTRRRLNYRLASQPGQLFRARKYWGVMPEARDRLAVAAWRQQLEVDCPALHDVLLGERDEFMALQVLMHLEARLAGKHRTAASGYDAEGVVEEPIEDLLQRLSVRSAASVSAALTWALDGPASGSGGLRASPEWRRREPKVFPPSERVVIVCGPAHVDGLTNHLAALLGAGNGSSSGSGISLGAAGSLHEARMFLSHNAACFPHLLANIDLPWELERLASHAHTLATDAASAIDDLAEASDTEDATEIMSPSFGKQLGILTRVCQWLWPDDDGKERGRPADPWLRAAPKGPVFSQERLRDLSSRPLPVWPVVMMAYVVCPAVVFVILPAKLDLFWFGEKLRADTSRT